MKILDSRQKVGILAICVRTKKQDGYEYFLSNNILTMMTMTVKVTVAVAMVFGVGGGRLVVCLLNLKKPGICSS